jgi:hypothetical protein
MTDRELLERVDRMLDRIDGHMSRGNEQMARGNEHMARGNDLMDEIRFENRLLRDELRLNRLEHQRNQARFEESKSVLRNLAVELRDGRAILDDIRHGIQANTEGLLRVLDEFRRGDGPAGAGA